MTNSSKIFNLKNIQTSIGKTVFNPPKNKQKPEYYYWIDLLRVIAAIIILIWHFQHFYYTGTIQDPQFDKTLQPFYAVLAPLYDNGLTAVQLFWIISGFVFSAVYLKSKVSGKEFFVNRFARLYPLHFLTLLVVATLQLISLITTNHFQIYVFNDLYHFILNLFFISGWGLESGFSFNAPIWSVSIEIFIYLLFFFMIPTIIKQGGKIIIPAIVLFSALILLHVPGVFWICGLFFFIGCLIFQFVNHYAYYKRQQLILGILGILLALAIGIISQGYTITIIQRILLFSSLIVMGASLDLLLNKSIGPKFKTFGNLTYGIYLWHIPTQIIILLVMEYFKIDKSIISSASFLVFFITTVMIIAYLSYVYFEVPMRRYIKKIAK